MGGPCDTLVPVAILYANPGLTLDEFSERLRATVGNIRSAELRHFLPFDEYELARILDLRHTKQYKEQYEKDQDREFSYARRRPFFYHGDYKVFCNEMVRVLEEGVMTNSTIITCLDREGWKAGALIEDEHTVDTPLSLWGEDACLQVTEVMNTEVETSGGDYIIEQRLKTRVLKFQRKIEEFSSIEDMARRYPEYAPRAVFDFTPETGLLFPADNGVGKKYGDTFRWNRIDDRYYIDLRTLEANLSPNSVYAGDAKGNRGQQDAWVHCTGKGGFSLSDIVLTCEAIRRQCWKVLDYIGFRRFFPDFIYSDAETLARYERAVSDSETSMMAQREGWTNTEFLRQHAFGQAMLRAFNQQVPFEQRAKQYRTWKKKHDKEMTRRAVEAEARENERRKNELPF